MGLYVSSAPSEEVAPLPLDDPETTSVTPAEIPPGVDCTLVYHDLCYSSHLWLQKNLDTLHCFSYQGSFYNPLREVRNIRDYNDIISKMSQGCSLFPLLTSLFKSCSPSTSNRLLSQTRSMATFSDLMSLDTSLSLKHLSLVYQH